MKFQDINITKFLWDIRVITDVTKDNLDVVNIELNKIECPKELIERVNKEFNNSTTNVGLTYANNSLNKTLIIVGKTNSKEEFLNTIAHEIYHFIYLIVNVNTVEDIEERAVLTGNFTMQLADIINDTLKEFK